MATIRLLDDGVDMIVYGELCSSEAALEKTIDALRARPHRGAPTLIAMGSGLSNERCPVLGLPYNQCTVLDSSGRVLWAQRKCHHFRMAAATMDACAIDRAGTTPIPRTSPAATSSKCAICPESAGS